MVNKSKIKIHLFRVFILTGLMLTMIFPGTARALTKDFSAGAAGRVSQIGRASKQLAPLAGDLPSGTPFLPSLLVNTIDTSLWDHPSSDPAGIAYQASTGKLLISDIDVEEPPQPFWENFNVFQSTLTGSPTSNCTTFTSHPLNLNSYNNFSDEPSGITINNSNNRIYFSDDNVNRIFEVAPGLDGTYCTSDDIVTYVLMGFSPFNLTDLEDLAYGQGKLYITSGGDGSASIHEYNLGANGVLGGGDDSSTTLPNFGTAALGFGDVEGIAYNSAASTLYILSTHGTDTYLGEITTSGTLLRAYDLSYLGAVRRSGLTIAPASGDPSTNNIYIVSRGADNGTTSAFNDGKIWEIDITNPVMPDLIFKDGFESGNFSAWTSSNTNGGNLSASTSAALFDNYGMRAVIGSPTLMDVTDDRPTLETRYRARFYFDPNSISMASNDTHDIFQGYVYLPQTASYTEVLQVQFRFSSGSYQVRGRILDDGTTFFPTTSSGWFSITDTSHFIELDWSAATTSGANNGYLTLWVDGNQIQNVTGIDNDIRRIDRAKLGPVSSLDAGTSGTYYFDAFESRRQSYIGPVVIPTVVSVVRADANPTSAGSVNYTVTFSESVTGVDVSDFTLNISGVSNPAVSGVSGSGATYTVTVHTGTGDGEIRLDVIDNNSIKDTDGHFLDTGFMSGETYLVIKNAEIEVNIAGNNVGNYDIPPQGSERTSFPGVDNGPVQIINSNSASILAAMRVIWKEPGFRASYSEMMGLPVEQLSNEYWFPWYNNLSINSMDQGFRIANLDTVNRTIQVWVGNTPLDSFLLGAGVSLRKSYDVDNGPIRILCSDCTGSGKIIAALRVIWKEPGYRSSYSEMMGLPVEQLSIEYWFPWYNNATASMDQGFRIANVDTASGNTVEVWVGNSKLDTITLAAGGSVRVGYNVDNGPARIVCTTCSNIGSDKVISALRVIWKEPGFRSSYSEMMGLPKEQLSTEYWFPWYNNVDTASMDQGFRIANVDTTAHTVRVFVGAAQVGTDINLAAGGSIRVGYTVNNGPIRIVCTTCDPGSSDDRIIAALRVIWQEPGYRSSYSEMMGLPTEALSTEYWFPWYNFAAPNSMDQGFRIAVP